MIAGSILESVGRTIAHPILRHDEPYCRFLESLLYPLGQEGIRVLFLSQPIVSIHPRQVTDSNQIGLSESHLREKQSHPDPRPVWLLQDGDRLTVWDGSHRVAAAVLETISARVVDLSTLNGGLP